jgi:hypothetical protein
MAGQCVRALPPRIFFSREIKKSRAATRTTRRDFNRLVEQNNKGGHHYHQGSKPQDVFFIARDKSLVRCHFASPSLPSGHGSEDKLLLLLL